MADFLEDLFGVPSLVEDDYSFDARPDSFKFGPERELLPVPELYDTPRYSPFYSDVLAAAGPIASGAARGLLGIPDLALKGISTIAGYETPSLGSILADEIYPEDVRKAAEAQASPWIKRISHPLGVAEEWITGGKAGADIFGRLGKIPTYLKIPKLNITSKATILPKLADYSTKTANVDAALGSSIGIAGQIADYISPGSGEKVEGYLSMAPLGVGALWTGLKGAKYGLQKLASRHSPELQEVLQHTPDELAQLNYDRQVLAAPSPEQVDAAKYSLLQDTGMSLPEPAPRTELTFLPEFEAQQLQSEVDPFMTKPSLAADIEIGDETRLAISKKAQQSRAIADNMLEPFGKNGSRVNELMPQGTRGELHSLAKDIYAELSSVPGKDKQAVWEVARIAKQIIGKKNKPLNPTVGQVKDLKEGLENIRGELTGKAKRVATEAEEKLFALAPQELQDGWTAYRKHAARYASPDENLPSKIIETIEGRYADPNNPGLGPRYVMSPEEITNVVRRSTARDFDDVADIVGDSRARTFFQNAFAKDLERKLTSFADGTPKGTAARELKNFAQDLIADEGLMRRVYGNQIYDDLVIQINKMKGMADVRELAHTMDGLRGVRMPDTADVPGKRIGLGAKIPTALTPPGVGGFIYQHLGDLLDFGPKIEEANRIQFNRLAPQFGVSQTPLRLTNPATSPLQSLGRNVLQQSGTYANAMADMISPVEPGVSYPVELPFSGDMTDLDEMFSGSETGFIDDKKKDLTGSNMAASEESRAWARATNPEQISVESGGDPLAVSPKGAVGLMQLMPAAKKDAAKSLGLNPDDLDLLDAEQNVMLGTEYKAMMKDKFGDAKLAFAAYNAGPTAVRRFLNLAKKKGMPETWESVRKLMAPYPGYAETINYVKLLG